MPEQLRWLGINTTSIRLTKYTTYIYGQMFLQKQIQFLGHLKGLGTLKLHKQNDTQLVVDSEYYS